MSFWKPCQRPQQPDPIPIPYVEESDLVHTPKHPFCSEDDCGCHDDPILIGELAGRVASGDVTPNEAIYILKGKGR
jgi:hypothetical protein